MQVIQQPLSKPPVAWTPGYVYPSAKGVKAIAIDLETSDPNLTTLGPGGVRGDGHVAGVSIAMITPGGSLFKAYYPIQHLLGFNYEKGLIVAYINNLLATDVPKVGANILYDLEWLHTLGIHPTPPFYDVQTAEALLNEERKDGYSLDTLAKHYLGAGKNEAALRDAAGLYGLHPKQDMWKLPADYVGAYAEDDAALTLQIWTKQEGLLSKDNLLQVWDLETRLIPVLLAMRLQGVRIDMDAAERLSNSLGHDQKALTKKLKDFTELNIDIWSNLDIAKACKQLDISYQTTPLGNPSFDNEFLKHSQHPFLQTLRQARKVDRLKGTYVDNLVGKFVHKGRIHAQFHATNREEGGTRTGRLSSSKPNLQQIPSAGRGENEEIAAAIRGLFIPDDGLQWAKMDYSQQEPRILVHYACLCGFAGAKEVRDAYRADSTLDFYQFLQDAAGISRWESKQLSLAKMYGLGKVKLSNKLQMPLQDAEILIEKFNDNVPFVARMAWKAQSLAKERGYVTTLLGRKRHFNYWSPIEIWENNIEGLEAARAAFGDVPLERSWTYKALNSLIQGSAADMTKQAMVTMYEAAAPIPYIQVHDEINVGVEDRGIAEYCVEIMEQAVPLEVPVNVDVDLGGSWK